MIRSDQVRKELAGGVGPGKSPLGFEDGIYSPEWTDRTYQLCLERADEELFQGRRVVVDATFREEDQRLSFLDLAAKKGVPGVLLFCEADPRAVRSRLDTRRHDLSDADWSIHLQAAREWELPGPQSSRKMHVIDTTGVPGRALAAALEILGRDQLVD